MIDTDSFLFIMKEMGFSVDELYYLTIGQALDFMAEYVANKSENNKESKSRRATQADFDSF